MPATVLIVEDEPTIAETLAYLLREDGYNVAMADTGPGGLHAFQTLAPDLILLDLMLPGMNGIEVCRTIRRSSNVPIIMVTARAAELEKVVGLEAGADDYLTKPFSIAELRARVQSLLRRATPSH
jgi:DNA-binding response OmpR family regulator